MKKILFSLVTLALIGAAPAAFAQGNLGIAEGTIPVGRSFSAGLNASPTGQWLIVSNSNPGVASAAIFGNGVLSYGLSVGSTQISVCSEQQAVNCMDVNVNVVGSVLGAFISAHVPGSWVIQGQTVYYVANSGLIPIPTWQIFLSNGGKSGLIQAINNADLNLPLLSLMTLNDYRVQ